MGLNNMTKNQLVQFFTNVELRNLITKDKNKMKKVNSMNTPKPNNNNRKTNRNGLVHFTKEEQEFLDKKVAAAAKKKLAVAQSGQNYSVPYDDGDERGGSNYPK